jgi:hypothetical protein
MGERRHEDQSITAVKELISPTIHGTRLTDSNAKLWRLTERISGTGRYLIGDLR